MDRTLVIILNHNLPELTDSLYDSIVRAEWSDCDLVVMDNGSEPGRVSRHTSLRVPENEGFGGALNRAFALVLETPAYHHLFFLNNDVVIETPEMLDGLREALASGHMIVSPGIGGHCAWPQMRRWTQRDVRAVPWVDFIAPLFHRAFIEHVRGFDRRLGWGWGQDVSSGLVCERQGWRIGVCDAAHVFHLGKQTLVSGRARIDGQTCTLETYRQQAFAAMVDYFTATGELKDVMRLRDACAKYGHPHTSPTDPARC